jgi:hypothetical protein
MDIKLRIKNIVLVGLFPIQNFDKYFFIKNKIASDEEISTLSVFNALNGVQLNTDRFQIVIQLTQLVITDLKPQENNNEIAKILETMILTAPITQITAMGINFHWYMTDNSKPIEAFSKELFYNQDVKLLSDYFNAPDSRYGLYASANFKDARLKLDVKPSTIQEVGASSPTDLIAFIFNFHIDLIKGREGMVFECLSDYESYIQESKKVVSIYK